MYKYIEKLIDIDAENKPNNLLVYILLVYIKYIIIMLYVIQILYFVEYIYIYIS